MRKSERYPSVTLESGDFCIRIDFDPQNELRTHGFYIWRPSRTGHDIDNQLDSLSRLASRSIQKRAVP